MKPTGIFVVTPMTVNINEPIHIKIKILGAIYTIPSSVRYWYREPGLMGQYNKSPRGILYMDNVLPEWTGVIKVDGGPALEGPSTVEFNGKNQGVFTGDSRPIGVFRGWKWTRPGIYWISLTDTVSGVQAYTNPVIVSERRLCDRIFWGDIHWQSYLTDGIRMPEELYSFARDEAFLDFGAASDHAEGLSDRQWEYFSGVTNDYNCTGSFATIIGYEWTSKKWGHRNVYYKGCSGPIFRSDEPDSDTLDKLWKCLEGKDAITIPHHTSNVTMGVDWPNGSNADYDKAVEVYSAWGSSECHADNGNTFPIRANGGEMKGRHVIDALKIGYRFGFVGAGDIHDGRPGDDLHRYQKDVPEYHLLYPQGLTAVRSSILSRECIYDAIKERACYATTQCRIYLEAKLGGVNMGETVKLSSMTNKNKIVMHLICAAPEDIMKVFIVRNGVEEQIFNGFERQKSISLDYEVNCLEPGDFLYIRVITENGNIAWGSPFFIEE